jgi:polysaccharide biosynthesis/export protein
LCLAVGFLAVLLSPRVACGQTVETAKQTNDRIQQLADQARSRPVDTPIGPGDLLHIDVFDVPELSRDIRVMETGDISFPLVPGRIQVAGLNVFQLQNKLAQLLIENGLISHPEVSVFVKEQNSQPISVVGAVPHPMVYQVVRPTTLLELLAEAGGISDDAGPDIVITRPRHPDAANAAANSGAAADANAPPAPNAPNSMDPAKSSDSPNSASSDPASDPPPNDVEIITIHLQDLLETANSQYDIPVHGGDTVRVPKAGIIYVLGPGIAAPGGYVLQGHGQEITALKVVAIAHGLNSYAKADSSVILRTNPATGKRDQIPVHLRQIEKNKVADVPILTNDILYVPDSKGKKALAQGTTAAVGIASGVALYRIAY